MYSCVSVSNYTHTDGPTHTHTHTHTHFIVISGGGTTASSASRAHGNLKGTIDPWAPCADGRVCVQAHKHQLCCPPKHQNPRPFRSSGRRARRIHSRHLLRLCLVLVCREDARPHPRGRTRRLQKSLFTCRRRPQTSHYYYA